MPLTAIVLAQGSEITTGATLDTNSGWLARELTARGATVVGFAAAPDDRELLRELYVDAGRAADLVVSSGGLGPTDDDLSAEAAALAAGVELELDAAALAQVEARFRRIERPMSPSNRKQALLPRGALLLENPEGTAPGFSLLIGRARAFFFPGVPRELYAMAPLHLWPWLDARGLGPSLIKRLHVCGMGESVLQDRLQGLALPPGVQLGYKTWQPCNCIVLYAQAGAGQEDAAARLALAREAVLSRLAHEVFGEDETTLSAAVGERLLARDETVAVAESCTAGLLGHMMTEAPGASGWFRGGALTYADELKSSLLGVPAEAIERSGAVSEEVAAAMAEGIRRVAGASWGLAITGIAGPGGGGLVKPVGLVCQALAGPHGTRARTLHLGDRGRDVVRLLAAALALEWLRRSLGAGPAA